MLYLLADADFKIEAVLRYRPDQSIGFASLAPSILVNIAAIPATDLIGEGSRVNYSLLVAGEELLVEKYKKNITNLLTESARISDRSDSNERTNQAINRSQQFLSMTTIISILLSRHCYCHVSTPVYETTHGYGRTYEEPGG